MVTLADSLTSSTARALKVRVRPDLSAQQQRYLGIVYWVIKEPVGLHYFRFQEEEYAILQMLDGETSLDEIKIQFERRFPPQKITVEELGSFVGQLHRNGLVIADVAGQGTQLRKRRWEKRKKEIGASATNILALRFRGIDPENILNWLYPKVKWIYSVPGRIAWLLLALSALTLVMVQFDRFQEKLPTFHQFFQASNWFYLTIAMALTKVIHEFGHGLTRKHFGGECHEMGIMFLVLTPALYCNVSDSWMLPNKWHRAWIGAAGMYVEIIIASICTFLWWFSAPGMLNQLALSAMFVCSVSTVIFNANPLLRYDGYYILSDVLEIPNLQMKARTILTRKLGLWCLGLEEPDDPFLPQRNQIWFAMYTIASIAYRWLVLFGIIWFIYQLFEPYGLKVLSQTLAVASIGSIVAMPIYRLGKFINTPGRMDQVKRKNVNITLGVIAAVIAFILFVPLPYHVLCPLELVPRDVEMIYTVVPGTLDEINVKPGQQVSKGDVLGQLRNPELDLDLADLQLRLETAELQKYMLRREETDTKRQTAAQQLPEVEKTIASLKEQIREKEEDRQRLQFVARSSGTIMPAPDVQEPPGSPGELPHWNGSPLDKKNLGAYLSSTLFCQIGDPHKWDAMLVVDQNDIEFMYPDLAVAIKFAQMPYRTFYSKIAEIGPEMTMTSKQLSPRGGGEVLSKADEAGNERPINTSFRARAPIDDPDAVLQQGLRGTAKVSANWQPIGRRVWRYLVRTFHFKL